MILLSIVVDAIAVAAAQCGEVSSPYNCDKTDGKPFDRPKRNRLIETMEKSIDSRSRSARLLLNLEL
jgi:hypothetical protein